MHTPLLLPLFLAACLAQEQSRAHEDTRTLSEVHNTQEVTRAIFDVLEGTCSTAQLQYLDNALNDLYKLTDTCVKTFEKLDSWFGDSRDRYDERDPEVETARPTFVRKEDSTDGNAPQLVLDRNNIYLVRNAHLGLGLEDLAFRWFQEHEASRENLRAASYTSDSDDSKVDNGRQRTTGARRWLEIQPRSRQRHSMGCDAKTSRSACKAGARGVWGVDRKGRGLLLLCQSFFDDTWPGVTRLHGQIQGTILANQEHPAGWLLLNLLRRLDLNRRSPVRRGALLIVV